MNAHLSPLLSLFILRLSLSFAQFKTKKNVSKFDIIYYSITIKTYFFFVSYRYMNNILVLFDLDDLKIECTVQMSPKNVKSVGYFLQKPVSKVFKVYFI